MRILFLCPNMQRYGTWFRCRFLAEGLVRRGHRVTLLKISESSRFRTVESSEAGIDIVETPRFWGGAWSHGNTRLPSDLAERAWYVVSHGYDLVHAFAHHANTLLPGLLARLRPDHGPLVMDWDDLWTDGGLAGGWPEQGVVRRANYLLDRISEHNLKRAADAVTVVSHDLRARAIAAGVAEDRICIVPNGAPIDTIRPGEAGLLRRRLGLPLEARILVFVGFGIYDVTLILEALRQLQRPGVLVLFVGPHPQHIVEEAQRRDLGEAVRAVGQLPFTEIADYLAASDVGLLPYADNAFNRSRWPIKLGDYLAAGLPIVTCRVGEMGRFLAEWPVGEATLPDAASFAQGIARVLDTADPGDLRARCRRAAEANSWDQMAARMEACYLRALGVAAQRA